MTKTQAQASASIPSTLRRLAPYLREHGWRIVISLALLIVAFGVWCVLWPVRRNRPSAPTLAWIWAVIEMINGVVHSLWSVRLGGYTPGVATAPLLFVIAVYLVRQLRATRRLE